MARRDKKILFSNYIDEKGITIVPNVGNLSLTGEVHRYAITVPFKERSLKGGHAIVIMFNPSKAGRIDEDGKMVSDETTYNVLNYLYQSDEKFSKVTILNLFSLYEPNLNKKNNYIKDIEEVNNQENDRKIAEIIGTAGEFQEKIIVAWGGRPKGVSSHVYRGRIKFIKEILKGKIVYHVYDPYRKSKTPQHGSQWCDYEKIIPYSIS
ncbi:DUF1643 domain-containing protein [Bacillus thuringiensis]|uniref:DUF1643 domain-containing protein n=1 Tax=Bacillus thuringiensis TaxID=1428 RepID=UPI000BF70996|nr:DUF1643 domain-containing protein [Bacillus thuringiensis]PEV47418.1 hypothetical protein CN426_07830 [Bacillus thuringiensis]